MSNDKINYLMNRINFILALSLLLIASCRKDDDTIIHPTLDLSEAVAPFSLTSGAKFYKDVSYNTYPEDVFDIFIPQSAKPVGLVIQIHGGGFKAGDKADNYSTAGFQSEVNSFLSDTIAFATLNYRLLLDVNETEGVLKPLNDCKRALQFIRYYCNDFNIDKTKIVVKGGSAGAGTSLWIGLNNDMADINAADPILRESTRVKAVVANNTQSTYDLLTWPTEVFSIYQPALSLDSMLSIATMPTFLQFYGIADTSELNTPKMIAYRAKVNMLAMITPDDPDIYLASDGIPYAFPTNKGNLIHHPLHAKTVMDKAILTGIPCKAIIPQMGINTSNGETAQDFLIRKLKN